MISGAYLVFILLFMFVGKWCTNSFFYLSLSVTHSGLMYGYTQTGLEVEGSNFAKLTGQPIPGQFKQTIIPSLLFGSLISATDPGIYCSVLLPTSVN